MPQCRFEPIIDPVRAHPWNLGAYGGMPQNGTRRMLGKGRSGIVNLTRSSRPSWPLSLERGQPYRRAKDFSAPNRRATDGRRIPPLLKLTMPRSL
jgi:hypothetical protein